MAHIALAVSNQERSRRFYETYFGFDPASAFVAEDGVLLIEGQTTSSSLWARRTRRSGSRPSSTSAFAPRPTPEKYALSRSA
jgi:catechol 2,3-dioxygenase-like lactoylglutathione lyase family enzyme